MTSDAGHLPDRVVATLAEGRRIEAIKALREATGIGLKEALDLVDQRLRDDASLRAAYNRAHHDIVSPGVRWAVVFIIIALAIFLFVRRI